MNIGVLLSLIQLIQEPVIKLRLLAHILGKELLKKWGKNKVKLDLKNIVIWSLSIVGTCYSGLKGIDSNRDFSL